MELKLTSALNQYQVMMLLIVPYGIETSHLLQFQGASLSF
jgi:hypothetical protein